jgi:putative transposase
MTSTMAKTRTQPAGIGKVLKRLHYPLDVILLCFRWYVAYSLSLRNLEEMMAGRGIEVDHSSVHRWVIKLLPVFEKAFRKRKRAVGKSWRVDESVSRTQARACGAVLKMGVGLLKPACGSRCYVANNSRSWR